jgi:hypothetical protein
VTLAAVHAVSAHVFAVRGFFLWFLFRALARSIGAPGATVVVLAVIVGFVLVARRQQQR